MIVRKVPQVGIGIAVAVHNQHVLRFNQVRGVAHCAARPQRRRLDGVCQAQAEGAFPEVRVNHISLIPDRQNRPLETVPAELPEQQFQKRPPGDRRHPLGSITNHTPQPEAGAAAQDDRIGHARHTLRPAR